LGKDEPVKEVYMLRLITLLIGCAIVILPGPGCGTEEKAATTPAEPQTLNENDAGRTITVSPGDTFVIVLTGNPTTGFDWELGAGDAAIIKQAGPSEFKPDSDALGAGGKVTMNFVALAPGKTVLRLDYRRSWETGVPAVRTFEITVAVT
jgi:inhibitor of cysteine peptidase